MPSAARLHTRLANRIRASSHTVTLVFPVAVAPVAVSGTPGAMPASPLTGIRPVNTLVPQVVTRVQDDLTMPCLWYHAPDATIATALRHDVAHQDVLGRHTDVQAVAEVLLADAAVDAADPYGPTYFDSVEHVEHGGQTYRVVEARPAGAGFAAPVALFVYLIGATGQPVVS